MRVTIGLKLPFESPDPKATQIDRKHVDLSISDIKPRALDNKYILEFEGCEEDWPKTILALCEALSRVKVMAGLFDLESLYHVEVIHSTVETHENTRCNPTDLYL